MPMVDMIRGSALSPFWSIFAKYRQNERERERGRVT